MASTPPPVPPAPVATPQPPAAKKTSPWVWVGVGCGVLLLLVVLVFVVGGLFLFKKGKDFIKTAEKNPAVAAAKIVAAADPDIEVVDSDDEAGTVTLRHKKTGETITLNAEDIKKGRLKFTNEKGEEVTVEGGQEKGQFKVSSEQGELVFGEEASDLPAWVPVYPGAKPSGSWQARAQGGIGGIAAFVTPDAPDRVMSFYEREMKAQGFSPNTSRFEQNGKLVGGLVQGKNAQGQQLMVTVTVEEGRTGIAINYEGK